MATDPLPLPTDEDDFLSFHPGHASVDGLGGDDTFHFRGGSAFTDLVIDGGEGTDTLWHKSKLILGDGVVFKNMEHLDVAAVQVANNATVDLSDFETSAAQKIVGSRGNESIIGTQAADLILTGHGDDTVLAGAGDDVRMGQGNDTLRFIQDGTATINLEGRGYGTITYGNGDIITFHNVENFEEIKLKSEYVLDFDDRKRIKDGDSILDGNFVASVSQGYRNHQGAIGTLDYERDGDAEAFNGWASVIGFSQADGEDFDFKSLSLANSSIQNQRIVPERNWANEVTITGYQDGVAIYTMEIDLTFEHVTHELNWEDIDQIEIAATGGSISSDHVTNSGWFSMDDLVFLL